MGRRVWEWVKKLAPWAVAAAILAYLFWEVPVAEAWRAARESRLELFVSGMLGAVLLWFLIESGVFAYLFSRFNAPLSWAEARSLRGVTYLATPVNWNLGTAAIILHLRSSRRIGAIESTSSMLFYQTIDGMVLAGLVLIGVSLLPESPEIASLRRIAAGFECVQVAMLAVLDGRVPAWRWLTRVRGLGTLPHSPPRKAARRGLPDAVQEPLLLGLRGGLLAGEPRLRRRGAVARGDGRDSGHPAGRCDSDHARRPRYPAGCDGLLLLPLWRRGRDPCLRPGVPGGADSVSLPLGLRYLRDLRKLQRE